MGIALQVVLGKVAHGRPLSGLLLCFHLGCQPLDDAPLAQVGRQFGHEFLQFLGLKQFAVVAEQDEAEGGAGMLAGMVLHNLFHLLSQFVEGRFLGFNLCCRDAGALYLLIDGRHLFRDGSHLLVHLLQLVVGRRSSHLDIVGCQREEDMAGLGNEHPVEFVLSVEEQAGEHRISL